MEKAAEEAIPKPENDTEVLPPQAEKGSEVAPPIFPQVSDRSVQNKKESQAH